jgi:ABC-2 type transport system ATP-binding protein
MISIQSVSKKFGSNQVLDSINLTLQPGKVYGLMGENGAGKSTLFRCMAGLESHDGLVIADAEPFKNHLGFLETDPFFFSKMTGREYIQLLMNARGKKGEVNGQHQLEERNIFDLPLDQYAVNYSTGMKKKLALQAILLQDNHYYILDEPFNGVDIQSNILITEIILHLKGLGKTLIISSHIFSTLRETCDEIYLLERGKITKTIFPKDYNQLETDLRSAATGNKLHFIK